MSAVWGRINTVILLLILFALLALIGMVASGVRGGPLDPTDPPQSTDSVKLPGTPISGQTTISTPGHYYLTRDITVSGSVAAIAINASNVSLDLGGFTLSGNDAVNSLGVWVSGVPRTNISISNGMVRDFHIGVHTEGGTQVRIDEVRAFSNGRGFHVGAFNVLSNCLSSLNTETGIYLPPSSGNSTISQCSAYANSLDGIGIDSQSSIVKDSVVRGNSQYDIRINGGDFTTVRDNSLDIMRIEAGSDLNYVFDNVCVQNGIQNNGTGYVPVFTATGLDPHYNAGC